MNSASNKPADMAIAFVAVMAAHNAFPGQAPTADNALVHLRYAVQFCWTLSNKLPSALCYTIGSHDARINAWSTEIHIAHIMPTTMNI
jgi:hypothetical protein